ncbi:hypothetical protein [Crocinitomix catalasitica]|uniref:hypothetical protein n=1 Tax=Crocinitomix catalasitica TaxID=184607 RepID=UPI0006856828|nr:hypothetical protein [Crocinitomix catalasitica]
MIFDVNDIVRKLSFKKLRKIELIHYFSATITFKRNKTHQGVLFNCCAAYEMIRTLTYLSCFLIMSCQPKKNDSVYGELDNSDSLTTKIRLEKNQIDTLLNTEDYLIIGDKRAKVKIVDNNEVEDFPTFKILLEYKNDVIIGENIVYDKLKIYKKYHPQTTFKDYPSEVYKGKLAEPDFSTEPDAKHFRTRINNECANGINFAGQYTLVIWGCGSPCQSGVVVNRKTGEIFGGYGTSLGSEFKKDSKMIIRNIGALDTSTKLIEVCAYCEVNHEIWTGTEFEEVQ